MMISQEAKTNLKKNRMDWILFTTAALILLVGTLAIVSSTGQLPSYSRLVRTHLIALPLSGLMFLLGWSLNYQVYQDNWKVLYGIVLASLVAVLVVGVVDKGSKSWFRLPFFSVQPSELCRIALILVMARFIDVHSSRMGEPLTVLKAFGLAAPVFYLILKQPDFSGVATTFPVIIGMLYCGGASLFHLLVIVGFGFIVAIFPVLWTFFSLNPNLGESYAVVRLFQSMAHMGWPAVGFCVAVALLAWGGYWLANRLRANLPSIYFAGAAVVIITGFMAGVWVQSQMKQYQRKRFEVFVAPQADPRGAGYNILQAQIAMGSGGLIGKGLFSGTQVRLGFVPERHTDFILAVVGEEMGFLGCAGVLGLYLLMLWRLVMAAQVARDQYGYLICCGFFTMFSVYMLINFGMAVGIVPVAGIPLPLVSYGGSNMVATLWAIGIAESIYARRVALV